MSVVQGPEISDSAADTGFDKLEFVRNSFKVLRLEMMSKNFSVIIAYDHIRSGKGIRKITQSFILLR